ncbi:cytochrome P450 [Russula emetica]|nr:cytochrome P450 [Russula emetica]
MFLSFPFPFFSSFLLLLLALILYCLRPLFSIIVARFCSPLRLLASPPTPSLFLGNLAQLADQENNDVVHTWTEQYGQTFAYRGFFNCHRLLTTDPTALSYILGHAYDFPKPKFITEALAEMGAGHDGLLTAQGDIHKRQRRIMNQAFSPAHIKSIIPIFRDKAERLRDIFIQLVDSPSDAVHDNSLSTHPTLDALTTEPSVATIDVLAWLSRATLDAMGEAGMIATMSTRPMPSFSILGFGYALNSLPPPGAEPHSTDNSDNELARAFATIFSTQQQFRILNILAVWFPFLRRFRPESRAIQDAQTTMQRIGTQLINERKATILQDLPKCNVPVSRDILSVLIRANAATSASQALTHSEMLSQISTFLAAGHETTASALTWTLYALARAPAAQTRLRAALRACDMNDIHAVLNLPLLEYTVREALRLHAPVSGTLRVYAGVASECFVPLRNPIREKQITTNGIYNPVSIFVTATSSTFPFRQSTAQRMSGGTDAGVFRPERWAALPAAALGATVLALGTVFALAEIKVFLACLLHDLEFLIDDDVVIEKRVNIVTRPVLVSAPEMGNQMPLRVRRVPLDEVVPAV